MNDENAAPLNENFTNGKRQILYGFAADRPKQRVASKFSIPSRQNESLVRTSYQERFKILKKMEILIMKLGKLDEDAESRNAKRIDPIVSRGKSQQQLLESLALRKAEVDHQLEEAKARLERAKLARREQENLHKADFEKAKAELILLGGSCQ